MRAPHVSVIVTSYNYASYIEACLDSVAGQTITDFDCVVVDDASTDRSPDLIERFVAGPSAGDRFTLKRHDANAGQMAAFRSGLAATDSEFVVFVDADDVLAPDFLETHLKAHLNTHHSVAFTCSDQFQIDAEGHVIGATSPTLLRDRRDPTRVYPLRDTFEWLIRADRTIDFRQAPREPVFVPPISSTTGAWCWSATSAMMFRRATLDLILCEECDRFRACADYYLCTFSQAVGGSLILPTAHGCYRRHGRNTFSDGRIVGCDRSLRSLTAEVPIGEFHDAFVTHVARNFDAFRAVVDEHQLYMILARFASPGADSALQSVPNLDRVRLEKCRITWKLSGLLVWLRNRFFWLRRIVSA